MDVAKVKRIVLEDILDLREGSSKKEGRDEMSKRIPVEALKGRRWEGGRKTSPTTWV